MTPRQRIEAAWAFDEPDRVPIELTLPARVRALPQAERLAALVDEHADNFLGVPGPDWGFAGFPSESSETVIEEEPGRWRRIRRVHETPAGTFTAVTLHPAHSPNDYHWEKRWVTSLEDLERLARTPRQRAPWDREAYENSVADVGERGLPFMGLFHPLGTLVRHGTMEEVYGWLRQEPGLVHEYLAAANNQILRTLKTMTGAGGPPLTFMSWAHEMLIPPWMGHELFDQFVQPYDKQIYEAIHRLGGRFRAHCHGNCMDFLEKFAAMGMDGVEPLEPPPYADVDLVEAKRRVGERMLLSGNVASQDFPRATPAEVREMVRWSIRAAAAGGGFTLRTTGGAGGLGVDMPEQMLRRVIAACEAYIEAGLEFGRYPIRA